MQTPTGGFISCFISHADSLPLFIHSQNEARVVHKWPRDRTHFVREESFASIQPFLAKIQEYIIPTKVMPIKKEMWQLEKKQPGGVHSLIAVSLLQSHRLPTACVSTEQEFQDPSMAPEPQVSRYHTSLNTFGFIGRRALKILSSRIQLRENSRMSLLSAFCLTSTSINPTADIHGPSISARY